ncbi:MAG: Endosomal/lysosomal potassium channel, partial [Candidatus Parcubacteria bacterium]
MESKDEKQLVERVETVIDRDRVLNFSDAIFAFAATLLVLKIDLPNIPPEL